MKWKYGALFGAGIIGLPLFPAVADPQITEMTGRIHVKVESKIASSRGPVSATIVLPKFEYETTLRREVSFEQKTTPSVKDPASGCFVDGTLLVELNIYNGEMWANHLMFLHCPWEPTAQTSEARAVVNGTPVVLGTSFNYLSNGDIRVHVNTDLWVNRV